MLTTIKKNTMVKMKSTVGALFLLGVLQPVLGTNVRSQCKYTGGHQYMYFYKVWDPPADNVREKYTTWFQQYHVGDVFTPYVRLASAFDEEFNKVWHMERKMSLLKHLGIGYDGNIMVIGKLEYKADPILIIANAKHPKGRSWYLRASQYFLAASGTLKRTEMHHSVLGERILPCDQYSFQGKGTCINDYNEGDVFELTKECYDLFYKFDLGVHSKEFEGTKFEVIRKEVDDETNPRLVIKLHSDSKHFETKHFQDASQKEVTLDPVIKFSGMDTWNIHTDWFSDSTLVRISRGEISKRLEEENKKKAEEEIELIQKLDERHATWARDRLEREKRLKEAEIKRRKQERLAAQKRQEDAKQERLAAKQRRHDAEQKRLAEQKRQEAEQKRLEEEKSRQDARLAEAQALKAARRTKLANKVQRCEGTFTNLVAICTEIGMNLNRQHQPMTTKKWRPDDATKTCMMDVAIGTCPYRFNFFNRRHHCRACGRVVCKAHSTKRMTIVGVTKPQRVCDQCDTLLPRVHNAKHELEAAKTTLHEFDLTM